ncbi:hypothetical protein P3G55_01270 [Leptospira sp. 96542]|nr:hypothetical protein [Leptospira sp. 96542]
MMKKLIWKYKYLVFLFFPLFLLLFSFRESESGFSFDLGRYFPKQNYNKEERMVYAHLTSDSENKLTAHEKKELARAIVRHAQRLQLPDGMTLGGYKPIPSLFLYVWAKTRTKFSPNISKGYGILALPEILVRNFERKAGAKINRRFDISSYSIQYKMIILLYKELLAAGETPEAAYLKLYGNASSPSEWKLLEKNYKVLHEQVTYESKP